MPPRERETVVLITCEHGGREVPRGYGRLFRGAQDVLRSHRGLDIGALPVAVRLAQRLAAPLISSTTTRLLVELNRSEDTPQVFSEFTRDLPEFERERLLDTYYRPYRAHVEGLIAAQVGAGRRVLHIGVHSFTDVFNGVRREVDVGLLFDPARDWESAVCTPWLAAIAEARPDLHARFNEPYLGTDDGLTTYLRTRFGDGAYAGIEIEVRQGLLGSAPARRAWADLLADTLPPGA